MSILTGLAIPLCGAFVFIYINVSLNKREIESLKNRYKEDKKEIRSIISDINKNIKDLQKTNTDILVELQSKEDIGHYRDN